MRAEPGAWRSLEPGPGAEQGRPQMRLLNPPIPPPLEGPQREGLSRARTRTHLVPRPTRSMGALWWVGLSHFPRRGEHGAGAGRERGFST